MLWSVLCSHFTESRICTLFFSSSYFLNQGISKISLFYLSTSDHTVYGYCWDHTKHRDSQFLQGSQPWSRNKNERIHTPHRHYEVFKKSICNHPPIHDRIFLDMNVSKGSSPGPEIQPSHASPSTSVLHPLPLSTSHLVCAKKINFSLTRGKDSHKPREGPCPRTDTDRLARSGWCFHKWRGLALTQQRKSCVCEESRQFLLVRKDTGARKPILSLTRKRGPAKQRPLPWPSAERKDVVNFLLPKTLTTSALTLRKQIHRNRLFCRNWELYTRDSALGGLSPKLSTPNICTHIPKMFPLLWNGCKCLSCRILSKQTAMNWSLQLVQQELVLNQAPCTSLQQIF